MSDGPIRVLIVEDDDALRDGLAALMDGSAGIRCTRRAASVEDALPALRPGEFDVALFDIGLPGMSGIAGVKRLKEIAPEVQVLMLTVYRDNDRIFEALCAGACGYLLKNTPPDRLLESIHEVHTGGAPMSPEIARRVVDLFRRVQPPPNAPYRLSPQEARLLKLLVDGHHYKTAAGQMGVSVHTVGFHMRGIYEKLQVHSKSEAVAKALREGLIR